MKMDYKLIFFVALLLLYLSFTNNYVGGNADDSIYIVLGQSLAEGNGYRIISSPENYVSMGHPPVFPLILSFIFILGGNLVVCKILISVLGILSIYFLYLFLKLFFKEKYSFLISAITSITPLFVFYTHQIMSEVPYFLFSILALYFFVKYMNNKFSKKYLFLCSLFILLSYFTRIIGFVLIISMGLFVLFEKFNRKDIKKLIFIVLIIVIPITLWSLRILANEGGTLEQDSYKDNFLREDNYNVDSGNLNLGGVINRVGYNGIRQIQQISKTIFHIINWSSLFYPKLKNIELFIVWVVFFVVCFGFVFSLKRRTIINYYFPIYLLFVLLIPDPSSRFLFPVIPFIIHYFITGIKLIIKNKKIILNLFVILIIISSLIGISKQIYLEHTGDYYFNVWGEYNGGFVDMAFWAKENIPRDNNVIVYNPYMFYLLSGIKGDLPLLSYNNKEVLKQIYKKEAEYIIIDKGIIKRYLDPIITKDKFEVVYEKDGNYIYKIISSD